MTLRNSLRVSLAAVLGLTFGACNDATGVGAHATVRVLLTDAPIDYVASAMVDIGAVELVPADDGEHVLLSEDGTDGPVNLLELQDAATTLLAEAEIEAGTYAQLRLIVESASVALVEGYAFNDGSTEMDLRVPSGAQTGIKLNLGAADGDEGEGAGGLEIVSGEMVLVVDFDVSRSFVIQGSPETSAGINSMSFKPTLRVVVIDVAGSISGTVATALDSTSVDSLTVTAEPADEGVLEAYQTQAATAMTDSTGAYTLHYLVPGTYWVKVTPPAGAAASPDSTEVVVGLDEDVADVDFELVAPSS